MQCSPKRDGDRLARKIAASSARCTSAIAIFQTVAAVARKNSYSVDEARAIVARFLSLAEVTLVPVDEPVGQAARLAFERYGKGRHPASLNMGD
ncbi:MULTISPECIES: type II toxin-antitoxin system VapC family toxin [Sphingobium]|uniref:Type II toxin-antitoxin system VapC family toxin n=1 Tax=Sphingobium tyrosinilyticum TaxID=2715436 RepID=A0ABV9EXW8_9SPHN|nr:type II toxin-antitoxin system VapC family toxin [Sphingobium sp. EP60837]